MGETFGIIIGLLSLFRSNFFPINYQFPEPLQSGILMSSIRQQLAHDGALTLGLMYIIFMYLYSGDEID
jgi:hypothetical protein